MITRSKAFTLVELIISIVIVGLLAWVIFSTYRTILDITVRVENEKIVANEVLFAHQVIQNLVDNYTIDFNNSRYSSLSASGWRAYSLFFTGRWGDSPYVWSYEITLKQDAIIMIKDWWNEIPLTDSGSVTVGPLYFQIIPYNLTGAGGIPIGNLYFNNINDIYHPAFWMYGEMKIRNYRPTTYIWSVKQPIQSFFNVRSY